MGMDRGFDLLLPSPKAELWASFLNAVQKHYEEEGDTTMKIDGHGNIFFEVGEHQRFSVNATNSVQIHRLS
jgi:hypothetical protein